jgi:small subunit ribosomal protein S6
MARAETIYDLVLILDPQAPEEARAKIVADTRSAIEADGTLVRHDEWGERALAYPIDRHATGEYHLLQLHPGSAQLLSDLDRTLSITDGLLRHRIIKLAPGTPEPPDMRSSAPARRAEGETAAPPAAPAPAAAPDDAAPVQAAEATDEAPAADSPPQQPADGEGAEAPVGEPA